MRLPFLLISFWTCHRSSLPPVFLPSKVFEIDSISSSHPEIRFEVSRVEAQQDHPEPLVCLSTPTNEIAVFAFVHKTSRVSVLPRTTQPPSLCFSESSYPKPVHRQPFYYQICRHGPYVCYDLSPCGIC